MWAASMNFTMNSLWEKDSSDEQMPSSFSTLYVVLTVCHSFAHHLVVDGSYVVMEDGNVFLLLLGTHFDGLLVASYRLLKLLLLEEVVALGLDCPRSILGTLQVRQKALNEVGTPRN